MALFRSDAAEYASYGGGYLSRHWQGELSLPVSYWINGILGGIIFGAVTVVPFSLLSQDQIGPIGMAVGWFLISSLDSLFTIWWCVGTWRSAAAYVAHGRPLVWALLSWLVVIGSVVSTIYGLGWHYYPMIGDLIEIARGDPEINTRRLHLVRNGRELIYEGGISFGAAEEVRRILDTAPQVEAIHLNSPGGRVAAAVELKNLIAERKLATYVAAECASACTIAFAGGRPRYIAEKARLGFHRPFGAGMGEAEVELVVREIKRILMADGVDGAFLNRAYSVPSDTMWYPSVQELLSARYATIRDGGFFAASELREVSSREDLENFLVAQPVYAAMRTTDPSAFDALIRMWEKARDEGASRNEIRANTFLFIRHHVRIHLPYADDESVIALGGLISDQLAWMKQNNVMACYRFAANDWANTVPELSFLPEDLLNREEQIAARIIAQGKFGAPYPNFDRASTQRAVSAVQSRLRKRIPEADTVLNNLRSPLTDRELACRTIEALFREALNGPVPEGALVLRQLVHPR